jgi:hypothetical protein
LVPQCDNQSLREVLILNNNVASPKPHAAAGIFPASFPPLQRVGTSANTPSPQCRRSRGLRTQLSLSHTSPIGQPTPASQRPPIMLIEYVKASARSLIRGQRRMLVPMRKFVLMSDHHDPVHKQLMGVGADRLVPLDCARVEIFMRACLLFALKRRLRF